MNSVRSGAPIFITNCIAPSMVYDRHSIYDTCDASYSGRRTCDGPTSSASLNMARRP